MVVWSVMGSMTYKGGLTVRLFGPKTNLDVDLLERNGCNVGDFACAFGAPIGVIA